MSTMIQSDGTKIGVCRNCPSYDYTTGMCRNSNLPAIFSDWTTERCHQLKKDILSDIRNSMGD